METAYKVKRAALAAMLSLTQITDPVQAQLLTSNAQWDFLTASPSISPANPNVTISDLAQGNNNGTTTMLSTTSASSGYAGASAGNNAAAAARVGALNAGAGGSAYFEVTLIPVGGVIIHSIAFGSRSTGTGPQAYSIRTSINGFASDAGAGVLSANSSWTFNNTALSGVAANGPVTLRIYGYGGSGSPSGSSANWRVDDVTLAVSASALPLPVYLLAFSARRSGQITKLSWRTAAEKNVAQFRVERSEEGIHFLDIGQVKAQDEEQGTSYVYADYPAPGNNAYYRLKIVDRDGSFAYSNIVAVRNEARAAAVLETNLVRHMLNLAVDAGAETTELSIFNLAGKLIYRESVRHVSSVRIDVGALPAGMYLLHAREGNTNSTFKFVKL